MGEHPAESGAGRHASTCAGRSVEVAINQRSNELIEDVSAASATYLWNLLPEIAALPACEGFERLRDVFRTAFLAYFDALDGWIPEPSDN
jgi:hypothetical protein